MYVTCYDQIEFAIQLLNLKSILAVDLIHGTCFNVLHIAPHMPSEEIILIDCHSWKRVSYLSFGLNPHADMKHNLENGQDSIVQKRAPLRLK